MIKLMVNDQEATFTTTIFPDGTSQVWKVNPLPLEEDDVKIIWLFENEAEMFHVIQLSHIVELATDGNTPDLIVPYLPYGRQDKPLRNDMTFALHTFKDILYNAGITRIETFDAHSETEMVYDLENGPTAVEFHEDVIGEDNYDVICFPDKGALVRYDTYGLQAVHCEKVRNQQTGEITGLKVVGGTPDMLFGRRVLIVDDICDGGMTFIKVAEALKKFQIAKVDLAVSHGLFSKGKQCLYDAGISNIFTTNSLLRNPEGFKVW